MGRSRKYKDSRAITRTDRPTTTVELSAKSTLSIASVLVWVTLAVLLACSLTALFFPTVRAFYRLEINYNEGWNVYNTQAAMQHRPLYPVEYGWTTVNYPFLSFYLVGYASRLVGDYLLTGRLISLAALLLSCVLVGLIVKKLTGGWGPAVFGGVFCLGLFCSRITEYVGMDDPQMLAHPFFLLGLWLYMGDPPSTLRLAGITSLFALGGNIKHNLIPVPLSILNDLFLTSARKAVRFVVFGVVFLALSIAINILVGGPFFISNLLGPRVYSLARIRTSFFSVYPPLGLPLAVSAFWSIWQIRNRQTRVISFYFFWSLLIGAAFAGGTAVNANTFFDNFFAMSIIMGAGLDSLWKAPIPHLGKGGAWRFLVPVLLYLAVVMMYVPAGVRMPESLAELPELEKQFDTEVSFLVSRPGPAICESLTLCYEAGKPYVLDPFNSTRLVRFGKLNSDELVKQIAEKKYGAIQTYHPVNQRPNNRFPADVLDAVDRYYVEAFKGHEGYFYIPRP